MESTRMLPDCEIAEAFSKVQTTNEGKDEDVQKKEIESLHQQVKEKNKALHCAKKECESLQQRVQHMNGMVAREGAMRYQDESMRKGLYQQLAEVKRQLEEEMSLKDKFMAAEEKARKEVEQLRNVLSNMKPAQNDPENTNKATLNELEAVRAEFAAQIQVTQDINTSLQLELELIKVSYNDLKLNDEQLVDKLRANNDNLRQQKDEEIRILQENASEREKSLAKQLEDLREQFKELTSTNLKLTANIKSEDENSQDLQQGKEPLCDSQAIEVLEEVSVPPENLPTKKKSSMWKRFRHFMGLKKRKRESSESN
ncbi:myosin-10-like [Scomber scombrus]|uniref:Myosin-10-like n=1 Tax=Scomber scombrus TaxID=13677 RepID=A0AAV1PVA0_SCOSC